MRLLKAWIIIVAGFFLAIWSVQLSLKLPVLLGYGLSGRYLSHFTSGEIREISRLENALDFSGRATLRGAITDGVMPKHDPSGIEFSSFEAHWRGSIEVPAAEAVASRAGYSGVVMHAYAGRSWEGAPVKTVYQGAPHFDVRDVTLGGLPSKVSVEWQGTVVMPASGDREFQCITDGECELFIDDSALAKIDSERASLGRTYLSQGTHRFRLRYRNEQHLDSLATLRWGVPDGPLSEMVSGDFVGTPSTGSVVLELVANSDAVLSVALGDAPSKSAPLDATSTRRVFSGAVAAGSATPIEVSMRTAASYPGAVLWWNLPSGIRERVPWSAFRLPPSGESIVQHGLSEVLLWIAMWVVWLVSLGGYGPRAFFAFIRTHSSTVGLAAILMLAAYLRFHDYTVTPPVGATRDEINEAWIGYTLLHNGTPTGWSLTPAYSTSQEVTIIDRTYPVVTPAFHPPPLFPLLLGVSATLGGAEDMLGVSLSMVRIVPILCSLLSLWLVWLISQKMWGTSTAVWSSLILATLPVAIATSRLAKDENLLVLLLLLVVWSYSNYRSSASKKWLAVAIFAAGLAPLTKPTGIVAIASLLLFLLRDRRYAAAVIAGVVTTGCAALYPIYGWYYDWGLFRRVFEIHGSMVEHFDVATALIGESAVVSTSFGLGWILWLWLTTAVSVPLGRALVIVPFVLYLALMAVSVDSFGLYGWYRIPLITVLAIFAGRTIDRMWQGRSPLHFALYVLLFMGCALTLVVPEHIALRPGVIRLVLLALLLPSIALFFGAPRDGFWTRFPMRAAIVVGIALNAYIGLFLSRFYP